ncbi:CRNN protein, partial [Aegotheles bennettii]|nr:CRNN protein [Aegotheles bennettii]
MAQLQENLNGIVAAFYICTRSDGNCSPLSREELRQLMEQEFAEVMENPQDPKTVKKVLCFLDDNRNCRVDFSELLSLVFRMAKACYKPLQQHQASGDRQELIAQEKAGGEQHAAGRVSHRQQVPEQDVSNQDTETQVPDDHETQEGETSKQDQDNNQTQEGETSKQGRDTYQTQEGETPKWDPDNHQTQEGETKEQDQDTCQTQEGETPEQDEDTQQDDGSEPSEGDLERGEILETAAPDQDRNTHKAEETEPPKTYQAKETEAPGQGSNHHQSPEMESEEQDVNCPSEAPGRDPNKTQLCDAPWQDPNPSKTEKLLPPQWGASPRWDPEPQGSRHDPAFHQLPETKVLEHKHSEAEAPSHPAPQQEDAHHQRQPAAEQQLLQALYQWPLEQ